ncbi:glutamate receptor ionotropic, NMDA 1 isoform X1 [Patella vulgata]|uniref:glutamate receptor ionotropic, NMDA 1 isoform X1 n=1 Tax=Patella vulgata TaxID=6465 RepID=UPI002180574F|nr:glutamate receptor ionotropic, NMDA 1 isoform X1 [Patella vulgata]XP_050390573.1 glutamate receptor ionotropic, NMDA 1 isoform X1 [Patella vulgata]
MATGVLATLLLIGIIQQTIAKPFVVTIGAALSSERHQDIFHQAVQGLNRHISPSVVFNSTSILMDANPIRSALDVCDKLLPQNIYAVIASHPNSSDQSPISVSYTCGFYRIPVIGITARDSAFSDQNVHSTFLRTVPSYSHQADVWVALLQHFKWTQVILIVGTDEEGRSILSRFQTLAEPIKIKIEKVIKFVPGENNYTVPLLNIVTAQSRVILMSASLEDAEQLYLDAIYLRLTGEDFAWIVTEQAFSALSAPIGLLGLHLINGSNEDAHIRDSISILGHGFEKVIKDHNITQPPSRCQDMGTWQDGELVMDYLRKTKLEDGETGQVSFNEQGDRQFPVYEIQNINEDNKVFAVGLYGSVKPIIEPLRMAGSITWPGGVAVQPKGQKISRNLTVVTIAEKPFVDVYKLEPGEVCSDVKEKSFYCSHTNLTTGEVTHHCCSGYCMDMLKEISSIVNFTFSIHLSSDGLFGSFERHNGSKQRHWNGMIGELLSHKADIIVAPLTINPERAKVIDFTKPFKYQGLTILVKKTTKDSSLASFLQPFQDTLWILVGLSVHVVALVLYLLDRFSPFGRFKLAKSEDTEEDALNLSSAMWFAWGVLLNSGIGEGTPRSFSARVLGMVWAGFAMIIVASYTANLAAFLVLDRPEASISGIDDPRLRNPNERYRYATVKGSAVEMYFKRQVELSTMYRTMENKNYPTAEEAIEEIRKEDLQAFIWDSPRLEFEAARDCNLVTAGELFGRSGLGIGLQKNSPWTQEVSLAVLKLHEKGFMEKLDNEWILAESTSACPESNSAPATLGLTNMAGVFMMVAGGIVAGVLLIFVEIAYKRHRGLKEKELELARNAADRWRGNIEKRRTLRQTLQKQREEQIHSNALRKPPTPPIRANSTSPIRRPSFNEAMGQKILPSTNYTPTHGCQRSGRTVTWHNPAHNADYNII